MIVRVAILRVIARRPSLLIVVISQTLELIQISVVSTEAGSKSYDSLVAELAGHKEVSALQNAQARGDRNGVEIFDFHRIHVLVRVIDRHFEQVTVF